MENFVTAFMPAPKYSTLSFFTAIQLLSGSHATSHYFQDLYQLKNGTDTLYCNQYQRSHIAGHYESKHCNLQGHGSIAPIYLYSQVA